MRVTVTVPDEIAEEVQRLADEEGVSVSAFYARAAEEHLRELRRKKAFAEIDRIIEHAEVAPDTLEVIREERQHSERVFE